MELYEEVENKEKSKVPMIIGICIGILTVIIIAIICLIIYLENSLMKVKIDGVQNSKVESLIYITQTETGEKSLYFPIREIANILGYDDYRGDYRVKSEDSNKCYVKNENEIAIFTKDLDTFVKTKGDTEYEYITLSEKVFEKDGELYINSEGIEKALNVMIEYDLEKNRINFYTMEYLNNLYASRLNINVEGGTLTSSEDFTDKKAIFQDMMIISNGSKSGVIQASTGEQIFEIKYDAISYLPATSEFLVRSNGKYGIMTSNASTKVRVAYDGISIMDNKNGLYIVKQNNLYGIIDTNGNVIVEPLYKKIGVDISKYESVGIESEYVLLDNLIPIQNSEGLWGIINLKGEIVKDFEFSGIGCQSSSDSSASPVLMIPSYKILVVEKDQHYNLVTNTGEVLISSFVLDSVYMKTDNSTGENQFFMSYNDNTKVVNVEDWLVSIGK